MKSILFSVFLSWFAIILFFLIRWDWFTFYSCPCDCCVPQWMALCVLSKSLFINDRERLTLRFEDRFEFAPINQTYPIYCRSFEIVPFDFVSIVLGRSHKIEIDSNVNDIVPIIRWSHINYISINKFPCLNWFSAEKTDRTTPKRSLSTKTGKTKISSNFSEILKYKIQMYYLDSVSTLKKKV